MFLEKMNVLVTGATGFLGGYIVSRLEEAGHFLTLQGSTRLPAAGPNRRIMMTGPFEHFDGWRELLDGVDLVVNLAGRSRISSETEAAYRAANETGARRLMEAMDRYGIHRLIHISSIAAKVMADDYGRTKKVGEEIVKDWAGPGRSAAILRPPLIYGPGAPGNMARLVRLVRKGVPLPIAWVDNRRSLLSANNAADAVTVLASAPFEGVSVYEVCDDEVVSLKDIVEALALGMGRKPMLLPFPPALLRGVAALASRQIADGLFGDLTLDNRPMKSAFGWSPRVRTLDGLSEMGRSALA